MVAWRSLVSAGFVCDHAAASCAVSAFRKTLRHSVCRRKYSPFPSGIFHGTKWDDKMECGSDTNCTVIFYDWAILTKVSRKVCSK